MRLSVIIPTFNRQAVLERCLRALQAQTYPDFEVLVVDGGNDGTRQMVAQDFPAVRYLRDPRSGPSAARNMGVEHASGDVVVFTDDDCLAPPDWLARLADGYVRHPDVHGVAGKCEPPEEVWQRNVFARHEVRGIWHIYGLGPERGEFVGSGEDVPGGTNNVSYRRAALLAVGGFSTHFRAHIAGEERDLRDRLRRQGYDRYLYVPVKVLHLRSYNLRGFLMQMLEQALGVNRHLQRVARQESVLNAGERQRRWRVPGLAETLRAGDWSVAGVMLLERLVYGLGRLLPERLNLRLIGWIGKG